ncbi:XkdQ/YqbQ family protein [Sporomusa malonica]|uniref:YqbQ/XkdQ domain-containing protein n=1 Tax=Sporomusa malonica TaxID=112901 RepID=A0A1W2ARJ1_9FIRM|nr:hypothetical protein [Sporomusa malonica]SMC63132.1 hypothetical protein SAMN04488500_10657 [Sporomusa malonica]
MNFIFGKKLFGRYIFTGRVGAASGGTTKFSPPLVKDSYAVKIYNSDGSRIAEYGSEIQNNPIISLEFEIADTGCGALEIEFGSYQPIISYGTRIDIHLFNDVAPWYSGEIIEKPLLGSTQKTFKYSGHGYYNQVEYCLVNKTYENMDIADIVKDIVSRIIEPQKDVVYRSSKIISTEYIASKLKFTYVNCKDALEQLAEFAGDYVYGVDEYREFYFKPISDEINEQARFWVGKHISEFEPSETLDDVYNYIFVKSGSTDAEFSGPYQDAESQKNYGVRQTVLTIPSAVNQADTDRWGQSQLNKSKAATKKADIKGLSVLYYDSAGVLKARKITTDGKARIISEDGQNRYDFPITKVKYKISSKGIIPEIELGDHSKNRIDGWLLKLNRDIKNNEYLGDVT